MNDGKANVQTYAASPKKAAKVAVVFAALFSVFVVTASVVCAGGWNDDTYFPIILGLVAVWIGSFGGYFRLARY